MNAEAQALYTPFTNVRSHKYLVWYNRSRRMMLTQVFLPSGWPSTQYNTVISIHGGGWRGGMMEENQRYNSKFADSSLPNGPFVVFSTSYGLTTNTYTSPEQQRDVEDFITLVSSAQTRTAFNLGTAVNKFGLSSGGHLLNLLAVQKDLGRVATVSPPSDLSQRDLIGPFIDYYLAASSTAPAGTPATAASAVSPTNLWTASNGSSFYIHHGLGDTIVTPKHSTDFRTKTTSTHTGVCFLSGVGHKLYDPYTSPKTAVNYAAFDAAIPRLRQFFMNGTKDLNCP